jgi:hypothetical protein
MPNGKGVSMDSLIETEIGILEMVAEKILKESETHRVSYSRDYDKGWAKGILYSCEAFRAMLKEKE